MHNSSTPVIVNDPEIVFVGFNHEFSSLLEEINLQEMASESLNLKQLEAFSKFSKLKVIVINLSSDQNDEEMNVLTSIRGNHPSLNLVTISDKVNDDLVEKLFNQLQIFHHLKSNEGLKAVLLKAFENSEEKANYFETFNKVKAQNKKLESLNENLEQLVHERTLKEFEANKRTEVSLKSMQWILSFIKTVSRSENVEDLMGIIRNEFKIYHSLMPPVLFLVDDQSQIRFFYFQGKQFTQKRLPADENSSRFLEADSGALRAELSNLFGRPFGSIYINEFNFQSSELDAVKAKIIFEHTLNDRKLDEFYLYSSERWPIINMALENILIKENLQNIAKQWARTFNEIKDPIIIVDGEFNMTLSNTGFHKEKNKKCYQVFANSNRSCKECPVQKTYETGEAQYSDIHVSGKVYRVHSYPIRLAGSESTSHVINQYVDITQSMNLHSKVIQGEKMAAVGLLAGNIAHELNNPLTGIFSLSNLLLEDLEKETNTYKDLNEVKEAASRCQRIIKDLLDFSSVGSESRVTVIDLNKIVSKTLPLLKMAMREINSDFQLGDEPILIQCNPQLFQQVIFNLVNNACQAMGEGGQLTVITEKQGDHATLIVRDTGSGIPDDLIELIFDPFFTTKEEGKGTGLGLSMSRSVIERQGGRLLLNRDYKDGTEFRVELPVVKNEDINS